MISQVAVFGFLLTVSQIAVVDAANQTSVQKEKKNSSVTSKLADQSVSSNFSSEESATKLLNRMVDALQSLNYHGTVVYSHDGVVESMQVIHKNGPGGEVERLVQLNGVPREVIRKNNVVTCYMSDSRSVLVGKRGLSGSLLTKLSAEFANFGETYKFRVDGLGRVAGKVTRIIDIQPKDDLRYGYKLWLSKENALLLKSELVAANGDVLERVMFVEVNVVDSIPESMLKPSISGESYTWYKGTLNDEAGIVQLDNWIIPNLPTGFRVTTVTKQQMPNTKSMADHVVISDGLASISVYIESFGVQSQPFVGSSRMGAVNIYGAVVGDHQVTVVGEVPQLTVKMIAESVAPGVGG